VTRDALLADLDTVRERGWATAPDEVITGVNTLAAPVFDHRQILVGSIAIVGATQFITPPPIPNRSARSSAAPHASRAD
jgi:DNA-binding IclR family transcriptional regulator